jgi:DNA-binding NtrC family response regulator
MNPENISNAVILVVDDESDSRIVTETILRKHGFKVKSAFSGEKALELLEKQKFDIVITDIRLTGIDGFELLQKAKDLYPEIVVAVMTGYRDTYSVREALLNGADEYIGKPFTTQGLMMIVERLCWQLKSDEAGIEKL